MQYISGKVASVVAAFTVTTMCCLSYKFKWQIQKMSSIKNTFSTALCENVKSRRQDDLSNYNINEIFSISDVLFISSSLRGLPPPAAMFNFLSMTMFRKARYHLMTRDPPP